MDGFEQVIEFRLKYDNIQNFALININYLFSWLKRKSDVEENLFIDWYRYLHIHVEITPNQRQ